MSATLAERLAARLVRNEATGCLEWHGARTVRGYGRINVGGRDRATHRVSWQVANGRPIPDGMVICHRCDNPPCCEPAHLFLGTQADNLADMRAKGRARNGAQSRFDAAAVTRIRALAASGVPYRTIAAEFDTSPEYVRSIAVGNARADVPGSVPLRRRSFRVAREVRALIADLCREGASREEAAEIAGVPLDVARVLNIHTPSVRRAVTP